MTAISGADAYIILSVSAEIFEQSESIKNRRDFDSQETDRLVAVEA